MAALGTHSSSKTIGQSCEKIKDLAEIDQFKLEQVKKNSLYNITHSFQRNQTKKTQIASQYRSVVFPYKRMHDVVITLALLVTHCDCWIKIGDCLDGQPSEQCGLSVL